LSAKRLVRHGLSLAGLLLVAGCGGGAPRGEVDGTVKANGKPLANVVVAFVPDPDRGTKGDRAAATTDADGRYRLRGGAVVGWHRVVVEDLAVYQAPRDPDGTVKTKPPVRFAARYADPLQTPLRKQVEAGSQVIDLDLKTGP
jgi:hypothetical protein